MGTPDTQLESMLGESFGSAGRSAGLGDPENSGREEVENPIIKRTPLWREQPPWVT